jgi:Zn-dependent protease with chaperone function
LLLSIFLCMLIVILQDLVLFTLLYIPLSLWNVHPLVPGIIAGLMLPVQFILSANIFSLFFMPHPGESEEEKQKRERYEEKIKSILDKHEISRTSILVKIDDIPLLMSFGRVFSKKFIVVSSGAFDLLSEEEMEILLKREIHILKRPGIGFFTSAVFLPFILSTASAWFYESARMTRLKRGTGAPYLAGVILNWARELAEFPILFISRRLHGDADDYATGKDTGKSELLLSALEKITSEFIKPAESGVPFRKHVFGGLRAFLPFDPIKASSIKIWHLFLEKDVRKNTSPAKDGINLENGNYMFNNRNSFSSHPPYNTRFHGNKQESAPENESRNIFHDLSKDTRVDNFLNKLPLAVFSAGLLGIVFFRLWIGIPLILAGAVIIVRIFLHIRKTAQKTENSFENFSRVTFSGTLHNFSVPGEIEARYSFIVGEERIIPVIFRQVIRSEEPLLFMESDEVEIEGIVRIEDVPHVDINRISKPGKRPFILKSTGIILQFLTAFGLLTAGGLFILIQVYLKN